MKFFSRELCEKLQTLGCKSESTLYWVQLTEDEWSFPCAGSRDLIQIPCFSQNDFTGCHPQARENAKIVWGEGAQFYCPCCEQSEPPYESPEHTGNEEDCINYKMFYYRRHGMIEAPDAEEYLKATMENPK